jgi:hypothetical protein
MENLYNTMIELGIEMVGFDDYLQKLVEKNVTNPTLCQIPNNTYDTKCITKLWAFFRITNAICTSKYLDQDGANEIIQNNGGKDSVENFVKNNKPYYDLLSQAFLEFIDNSKNVSILRFIPNWRNQNMLFFVRVKDKFIIAEAELKPTLLSEINQIFITNNLIGNIIMIDCYSE